MSEYQKRRTFVVALILVIFSFALVNNSASQTDTTVPEVTQKPNQVLVLAIQVLEKIEIKGRAPKTGYERGKFGADWSSVAGCDTRNVILNRDLSSVKLNEICQVVSGVLIDPYSGKEIQFIRGAQTSSQIQIDHVVALSDAWQKGAQTWEKSKRVSFANDPLELLAVDSTQNQNKSDGDAATWLPPNKSFRCEYVSRQIAVKFKYNLWVTRAEHDVMLKVLDNCPSQQLPSP